MERDDQQNSIMPQEAGEGVIFCSASVDQLGTTLRRNSHSVAKVIKLQAAIREDDVARVAELLHGYGGSASKSCIRIASEGS